MITDVSRLAGSLVLIALTACHSVRSLTGSDLNVANLPARVWVSRPDDATVQLDAPLLRGDTLSGFVGGDFREFTLSQQTVVRAKEPAPGRTAVLVALASGAALASFLYLEARRDVGNAPVCLNALDQRPMPFTPCCPANDSVPC